MSGSNARLAETLAIDRGNEVPDSELTFSSRIRRRLLRGETLTPKQVVAEVGGSNGLTAQVVRQLDQLGFDINRDANEEGLTTYTVTNPDHEPTDAQYQRATEAMASKKSGAPRHRPAKKAAASSVAVAKSTAPPPRSTNRANDHQAVAAPGVDLPPLPGLGQAVTVYALALNDDGSITVGLRNGTEQWLTDIVGHSQREST
jgi:hypothetical protein